jgi:peptide/nickel transport system permease protein
MRKLTNLLRFLQHNPRITTGFAILGCMLALWVVGMATIGTSKAVPLSGPPDMEPSARYLLGTDSAGRQLLPVIIAGIPLTLEVGLLAGGVGLLIGTLLGFTAGYFGGLPDTVIRTAADIMLPIPALGAIRTSSAVDNASASWLRAHCSCGRGSSLPTSPCRWWMRRCGRRSWIAFDD